MQGTLWSMVEHGGGGCTLPVAQVPQTGPQAMWRQQRCCCHQLPLVHPLWQRGHQHTQNQARTFTLKHAVLAFSAISFQLSSVHGMFCFCHWTLLLRCNDAVFTETFSPNTHVNSSLSQGKSWKLHTVPSSDLALALCQSEGLVQSIGAASVNSMSRRMPC